MSVRQAGAIKVTVDLGGEVPPEHIVSVVIQRDVMMPDEAVIVLTNDDHRYSKTDLAKEVKVKVGDDNKVIYMGEVAGLEPSYTGGEKTRITIRAYNKLHRLTRKRKSLTYCDKTDQQILQQVVQDSGLSLEWKHEKSITYKHVYQHNQTNLEFLRTRAARLGCHVWCWDKTVYCKQIDLQQAPGVEIKSKEERGSEGQQLRSFTPKTNTATVLKKVTVKGWNPEAKELITGEYSAQASKMGSVPAHQVAGEHGSEETFQVDHPIWSKEEAEALAKAKQIDGALQLITGEAQTIGDPAFDLAKVVKITVNTDDQNDFFNGRYYVMGITYRYTPGGSDRGGGFVSQLRLARDAAKGSGG